MKVPINSEALKTLLINAGLGTAGNYFLEKDNFGRAASTGAGESLMSALGYRFYGVPGALAGYFGGSYLGDAAYTKIAGTEKKFAEVPVNQELAIVKQIPVNKETAINLLNQHLTQKQQGKV